MFHVMQIFLMCAAAVYLCAMVVVEVRRFRAPIEIREVPLFDENDELYITCDQKMSVDEQLAIYAQLNAAHSAAGIHAVILNRGLRIEAIKTDKASPVKCPDCDGLKTWCPFDFRNDREPGGFCWLARRAGGDHV